VKGKNHIHGTLGLQIKSFANVAKLTKLIIAAQLSMQSLSVSFFLVIFHHFQKVTRDITLITPCPRLLFFGQGKET